jgi:SAM-dependent methyltransferase
LEVIKFISKNNKEKIKLLDVGAQDSKLKNLLPKNVEYFSLDMEGNSDYQCDLNKEKIPVKEKSFDIVVCLETLEHVFYPDKVIEELKRVTKPDGTIILSMPNEYNLWLRLNYLFGVKKKCTDEPFEIVSKLQHIHKPRVKDIIDISNKHLKIIKIIPIWQSRKSTESSFFYNIDKIISILAKIYPSLFARLIVVIAKKKQL